MFASKQINGHRARLMYYRPPNEDTDPCFGLFWSIRLTSETLPPQRLGWAGLGWVWAGHGHGHGHGHGSLLVYFRSHMALSATPLAKTRFATCTLDDPFVNY